MLIALLSELAGTVVVMAAMVMAMMWITITTDYPKLKSVLRGHQVGKRVLRKEDRQKKERRRPHGDMFWQLFFFLLLIN